MPQISGPGGLRPARGVGFARLAKRAGLGWADRARNQPQTKSEEADPSDEVRWWRRTDGQGASPARKGPVLGRRRLAGQGWAKPIGRSPTPKAPLTREWPPVKSAATTEQDRDRTTTRPPSHRPAQPEGHEASDQRNQKATKPATRKGQNPRGSRAQEAGSQGGLAQSQVGISSGAGASAPGAEKSTASRLPHSRYPTNEARNSGSEGNPTSSAVSINKLTHRRRCSSVIPRPTCREIMCACPPRTDE